MVCYPDNCVTAARPLTQARRRPRRPVNEKANAQAGSVVPWSPHSPADEDVGAPGADGDVCAPGDGGGPGFLLLGEEFELRAFLGVVEADADS